MTATRDGHALREALHYVEIDQGALPAMTFDQFFDSDFAKSFTVGELRGILADSPPVTPAAFFSPPAGAADPLYPAAARFVAARPSVGPVALVRRFGIGRGRALLLLDALDVSRVLIGPGHRAAWRVNPHAWAQLVADR